MKLIIDIPEEIYDSACATNNIWDMRMAGFVCSAIANGTPLNDVKAEIEEEYNRLSATRADETLELGKCLGLKMTLKILDNIGKAESEET